MKTSQIIGKIITVVLAGIFFGGFIHFDHVKRGQMGRDEFLAKAGERYDKFFSKPADAPLEIIVAIFMVGVGFGAYELVAFGLSKALKGMDQDAT